MAEVNPGDPVMLRTLYAGSLQLEMNGPDRPSGRTTGQQALRHMIKANEQWPVLSYRPEGRVWLYSDLHLHHRNIIDYCSRPFADIEEMDATLLERWEQTVEWNDTIVVLGDVALAGAMSSEDTRQLARLPGHKLLVRGNHDFGGGGKPVDTGMGRGWMAIAVESEPPLLFTHVPLAQVPTGAVNVHGHTHEEPTAGNLPRINVSVEQTEYRPIELKKIAALATLVVAGRASEGKTTAARAERAWANACRARVGARR